MVKLKGLGSATLKDGPLQSMNNSTFNLLIDTEFGCLSSLVGPVFVQILPLRALCSISSLNQSSRVAGHPATYSLFIAQFTQRSFRQKLSALFYSPLSIGKIDLDH